MSTYAVKNQNEKSQSGTTSVSKAKSDSNEFVDFFDQRPEVEAQSRVQEIADRSSQSIRLSSFQQKADSNTNNSQPVQLKRYLDLKKGGFEEGPIQKNENKTGLPDTLKVGMESLSGVSMDDVKVHLNSKKPEALHAHAFAQGTDIHVGPGQEKHLPHEAWHVVQQKQGRVKATVKVNGDVPVNDSQSLEKEATYMGQKALNNTAKDSKASLNQASIQTPTAQLWPKWLGGKGDSGPKKEEEEKEGIWSKIKNGASAAGGAMRTAGGAVGGALRTAGGAVGGAMSTAGKMVKRTVVSGVQTADDFILKAPDRARGAVAAAKKTASKVGGKLGAGAGAVYGAGKFVTNSIGLTDAAEGEEDFKKTVSKNSAIGSDYGSNKDNITSNLIKEKATAKKNEVLDSFTTSVGPKNRLDKKLKDRGNRIKDGFEGKKTEGHRGLLSNVAGKTLGAAGGLIGGIGGGFKGLYDGYKSSGKGFMNTAKGMFSGAKESGKEWATAGYKKGDQLGDKGVENVKSGVGMAVGAATGTVGALGGAVYGGMKGLYSGYKTSGEGFKNTAKGMLGGAGLGALTGGIEGGLAGYDVGKKGTSGLIGLAEELPGFGMDLVRTGMGAASGTVGALGGAVYGGAKGLADGYKTSEKGFKNTAKGMLGGAGSGAWEGGKAGASKGFEMGANSKAARYIRGKGIAKLGELAGNAIAPGLGTVGSKIANMFNDEYDKEDDTPVKENGNLSNAMDLSESVTDLATEENFVDHSTKALGVSDDIDLAKEFIL